MGCELVLCENKFSLKNFSTNWGLRNPQSNLSEIIRMPMHNTGHRAVSEVQYQMDQWADTLFNSFEGQLQTLLSADSFLVPEDHILHLP